MVGLSLYKTIDITNILYFYNLRSKLLIKKIYIKTKLSIKILLVL